jgi:hypothetical protein
MSGLAELKRRGILMMAVSGAAFLAAIAGFVLYFAFGQGWARIVAVAALVIGFGAQTWLVASLRNPGKGA